METMTCSEAIDFLGKIKGASFVSLVHTAKETGEVAQFVVNLGVSHRKKVEHGRKRLIAMKDFLIDKYSTNNDPALVIKAYDEILHSLNTCLDGTNVHHKAMVDAYERINKGISVHKETGNIMITGDLVSKKVLTPGVYKEVKHRPKTIIKNGMEKDACPKIHKTRTFLVSGCRAFRMEGRTIVFI